MAHSRKRTPKWVVATVIPLAIAIVVSVALIITNIFVPIRYLSAYLVTTNMVSEGEMRVSFLDVGMGDSALVEFPDGKVMLIDGGDGAYPHELSLLKQLNSRGVNEIDFLICTSVKGEHCGGLTEILKYKAVKKAFIPYLLNTRINEDFHAFMTALNDNHVPFEYASVGVGYVDDDSDLFFTFLSPTDKDSQLSEYADMNAEPTAANIERASIVTWLQYGKTAFAFTSDARAETLENIVEKYETFKNAGQQYCKIGNYSVQLENCNVVTVAAHGGEKNSSAAWYDAIKPEVAIISVGANYSSLPSYKSVTDALAYTRPLQTDEKGNIIISVKPTGYSIVG